MRRWRFLFAGAKYLIAGALVAGAFVATSGAVNADGMAKAPQVVQQAPTSWSGLYFGVHSGFEWADVGGSFVFPPPATWDLSHSSYLVGGHIGIQHQFGNVVLGVEGNLSSAFQNNPASGPCVPAASCAAGTQITERFDDVLTVGPRLGWAMGKWMPYITGGYANAAFTHKAVVTATATTIEEARHRHSGWYIGGGVEMALSHGWTVGLEYRHYDLDDKTAVPHTPAGVAVPFDTFNSDATLDTVTLRVSWKLGRPEPVVPLK